MERNRFLIEFNGESKLNLTPDKGWHDIYLSRGFDFFMDKYSYLNTPPVYTIKNNKGNLVRTLKDNQSLKTKMLDYDLTKVEFIQVPNNEGIQLNGWIMKPTKLIQTKVSFTHVSVQLAGFAASDESIWHSRLLVASSGYPKKDILLSVLMAQALDLEVSHLKRKPIYNWVNTKVMIKLL